MTAFQAEIGKFIVGRIQPPVDDVHVHAVFREDPSVTLSVKTDASGQYKYVNN